LSPGRREVRFVFPHEGFAARQVAVSASPSSLIVTQVALSLLLLLGAGLLVRTFQELRSLDLGFDKDNLFEIIPYPRPGGHQNLDTNGYHRQIIERISNIPGVPSVGLADISIPNPQPWRETAPPMSEDPNTGARIMASGLTIWPGFFRTLGI
jgi:putative ABC transport system permease protein